MARSARSDLPDWGAFHVTARGVAGCAIYDDDSAYRNETGGDGGAFFETQPRRFNGWVPLGDARLRPRGRTVRTTVALR